MAACDGSQQSNTPVKLLKNQNVLLVLFGVIICINRLKDLPHHIETNWQAWKRFYEHPDCYILPAPCDSLEPLEQLLIIKHLKPNAFMTATSVELFRSLLV